MKIKEIEYGETKSVDFNNVSYKIRAELDNNETEKEALSKIKKLVRTAINKSTIDQKRLID